MTLQCTNDWALPEQQYIKKIQLLHKSLQILMVAIIKSRKGKWKIFILLSRFHFADVKLHIQDMVGAGKFNFKYP